MRLSAYLLAIICVSVSFNSQAQVPELEGLDEFIHGAMEIEKTPGVAVAVVRGSDVIYSKGFGVREVGSKAPVDGDTIFAIGSATKYMTATALGLLVDEGKLDWDEPLTSYLPNLRFSSPYLFNELNLRDALSHRSGLKRSDMGLYANSDYSREQVLATIENLPQQKDFRASFVYSNYLYLAAGETIPAVSEQTWDDVIKDRIFKPLHMTRSTTSTRDLEGMKNVAMPHSILNGEVTARPYYNADHFAAAGSINSSVNDMAQWCKVQLADGKLDDQQIIPEAVVHEVRKPHNLLPLAPRGVSGTEHSSYGLGVFRNNYRSYTRYEHKGGIDGMLSDFMFIPEADVCIVVLTNNDNSSGLFALIGPWVIDHLFEEDVQNRYKLETFKKRADRRQTLSKKRKGAHKTVADTDIKPTEQLASFTGRYVNKELGDVVVDHVDGVLRFAYGPVHVGRLLHHRGNSFDLVDDVSVRNINPVHVNFVVDGNGKAESVSVRVDASTGSFMREANSQ